ncbi:MAG: ATP-binding protein, partial [Marinoscillum sp.]
LIVTKNIATRLRPAILDKLGLIPAIEWLVEDQERKSGVSIYLAIQSSPGVYDNSVSIACFRICQEALTNAMKHAKASELTVSLEEQEEFLLLSIDDNGVGMDMDNQGKPFSLGILGMKERAELINGVLDINSKPGSGTKIQLKVPVK